MTFSPTTPLDHFVLVVRGGDAAAAQRDIVWNLYAEVFAEPLYRDGPAEVEKFAAGWPRLAEQPAFRLVIAYRDGEPIGFTFGRELGVESGW